MANIGIIAKNLTKKFGSFSAVDGIDLIVPSGQILGLLGINGAGKTTTMRLLAGYYPAAGGEISHNGYSLAHDRIMAQRQFGYLPEGAPLPPDFRAIDHLRFMARLRGLSPLAAKSAIDRVIAWCNLDAVINQPIETLSKGFKRRLALAQCLLHDPKILILDEPTDGLDPNQKYEMRQLLRQFAIERAIIVSTHILDEVEAMCDRIAIIHQGRLIADTTPQAIVRTERLDDYFRRITMTGKHHVV